MKQLTVSELKHYWEALDNWGEGERIDFVYLWQMPAWTDLCSELSWESHLVDAGYFGKKHHGYCGVYRLIGLATESELHKPATLNRACGQDTSGTLYIGEAGSLNSRLNQLRRSLFSREDSHGAIRMLTSTPLREHFPNNKLAIALLFTSRNTRRVEANLIQAYMNSFGDTPPLNYRIALET